MKGSTSKRALSFVLVLVMLLGLLPGGALRADAQEPEVTFRDVPNTYEANDLMLDSSLVEETASTELPLPTDENGNVRVSIVLEQASTLEKMDYLPGNTIQSAPAKTYRAGLEREQATMETKISRTLGHELNVVWNLTLATNAISAWVAPEEIDAVAALPGVKQVIVETRYDPCTTETAQPQLATSAPMIGADTAWAAGYTGKGQRIAIIDTGLDTDHQSVDEGAFLYALGEDDVDLMDKSDISAVYTQLNVYKNYLDPNGNSVDGYASPTVEELYRTAKIPYGYNYVDRNMDITHDNDSQGGHGSHVAGIAAANRYIPDGAGGYADAESTVHSLGVAPDAQLIVMKVFGAAGGAYESDIVAALEDAVALECDSVNLSLGSATAGFTTPSLYEQVLQDVRKTGTVVTISSGNSGAWAENTGHGYLYTDDVNLQTGGSPGTYTEALTVASVENDGMIADTFTVGDHTVGYYDGARTSGKELPGFATLDTSGDGSGTEYEYVFMDKLGAQEDYSGVSVRDKIVFVRRGEFNFSDKHKYASWQGAKAVVIYNNSPGAAIKMDVTASYVYIPAASISLKDADAIRAMSTPIEGKEGYYTGKLTVADNGKSAISLGSDFYTMSSFSSWGIPGSLSMKPEITAPGGSIYSIDGTKAETDQYTTMSGTSMAAPQVAGLSAALGQYVEEAGLVEKTGLSQRHLVQSLLMSTADVLKDENGLPYPLLLQGAGLANAANAMNAGSYITVAGQDDYKVKAELGDDPDRTGEYIVTFTVHNFTDAAQSYALSGEVYTQTYFEDDASFLNAEAGSAYYMDYGMTTLGAGVTFAINGKPLGVEGKYDGLDFDGDGESTRADGQALLDYAVGKLTALPVNQDRADLNGDGKVTAFDAELYLKGLGSSNLQVPANGEVTVTAVITLTDGAKAELNTVYENGAYIEAYIHAEAQTDAEGRRVSDHSIPVLAFYGDWQDPSMFDPMTYSLRASGNYDRDSYFTGATASGQALFNYVGMTLFEGAPEMYLGSNPFVEGDIYNPDHNAISGDGKIVTMAWTLIRNAADFRAAVENAETGEAYYESIRSEDDPNGGYSYAPAFIPTYGQWYYVGDEQKLNEWQDGWNPVDTNGNALLEGTTLNVILQAATEYALQADGTVDWENLSRKNVLSIPVTVDNTAPEMEVTADEETRTITVKVQDNRYTAAVILMSPSGKTRLADTAINQQVKGAEETVTLDVSDIWGSEFQVVAVDYAGNVKTMQAFFGDPYDGPKAKLMGATATDYFPTLSTKADWDTFDSNTNLDYDIAAKAHTGAFGTAYGDGYMFYCGNINGRQYYGLYVLDYPNMTNVMEASGNVSRNTISNMPILSMAYVSENGGRLYYIQQQYGKYVNGSPTWKYGIRTLDVADGSTVNVYDFAEDVTLVPTSIAYDKATQTFYLLGYENVTDGKQLSLYKLTIPNSGNIQTSSLEKLIDLGMEYTAEYLTAHGNITNDIVADTNSLAVETVDDKTAFYISIRSTEKLIDYIYSYDGEILTNTGKVRSHESMILVPDENDENSITRQFATGMKLTAPVTEVYEHASVQVTATLQPWCLENKAVTWSSSDTSVAIVDENGRVTGVKAGTVTITATSVVSPGVSATMDIKVKAPEFTLSFVATNDKDESRMYTYDFAKEELSEGATFTDMEGNTFKGGAADLGNYGKVWVQDQTPGEYRLHRVDPVTGVSDFDSEVNSIAASKTPFRFHDIAYDDGDATTDDSEWILALIGNGKIWCTQDREKPNTMNQYMAGIDGVASDTNNIVGVTYGRSYDSDGTMYYPIYSIDLATNRLILRNLSYNPVFGLWGIVYAYYDMTENLTFLRDENGRFMDTLTIVPNAYQPMLMHYKEDGTYDVYLMQLEITSTGATQMGTASMMNLGNIAGFTDVYAFAADAYGDSAITANTAQEAVQAVGEDAFQPLDMEQPAQGGLNAVSESGTEVAGENTYNTLTIKAEADAASGMITVELDEALTIQSLNSSVDLHSYYRNGDTITFGYASENAVKAGDTLAVLKLNQATQETTATVTETERGGEAVNVVTTATLAAKEVAKATEFTLRHDFNGGMLEDSEATFYDATKTLTEPAESATIKIANITPVREGYKFKGWADTADAKYIQYKYDNGGYMGSVKGSVEVSAEENPKTVYAVWEQIVYADCTLNYAYNNGTDEIFLTNHQVKEGNYISFKITSEIPVWEGHTFVGWSKKSDDTSNNFFLYKSGQSIPVYPVESPLTLYAVWEETETSTATEYTLTYDVNGGAEDNRTVTWKSYTNAFTFTVSDFTPTKTDCTFLGWAESADATTATYQAGDKVELIGDNASKTLYAVWEQPTGTKFTLTYNLTGGEIDGSLDGWAESKYFDGFTCEFTITDKVPTKAGYNFKGWATNTNPGEYDTIYHAGDTCYVYMYFPNTTLFAIWERASVAETTYTLTYDVNGGAEENTEDTFTTTEDSHGFTVSGFTPTREGYTFKGWADTADATAAVYTQGATVTLTKDAPSKTIYAVWEQEVVEETTYTLTYDVNGGAEENETDTATTAEDSHDFTVSGFTPTKTDFVFKGWADTADASAAVYTQGAAVTVTKDAPSKTIYAVWEAVPVDESYKQEAIDELQAYYDALLEKNEYSEAGRIALELELIAGKAAIDAAENEEAALAALEAAKKALDDVLTYPEELVKAAEAAKAAAEAAQQKAEEARRAAEEAKTAAETAAASAAEDKEAAENAARQAEAAEMDAKKAEEAAKIAQEAAEKAAEAAENSELQAAKEAQKAAEEAAKAAEEAATAAQSAEAAAKAAEAAQAAQAKAEEARDTAEQAKKDAEEAAALAGENSAEAKEAASEAVAAEEAAKAAEQAAENAKAAAEAAADAAEASNLAAAKAAAEAAQYAAEVAEMYNEICAMKLEMSQYLLEAQKTRLDCAKYYALMQLTGYADKDDYAEAQQAELADAIEAGTEAIREAKSIESVNKALSDAMTAIDAIKTRADLEAEKLPFTDVAEDAWYYDAVKYVYNAKLFNGTGETAFSPEGTMTRAMLVTVLYRMAGEPDVSGLTTRFTDLDTKSYYYHAVLWATENGITKGVDQTHFVPDMPVTREEMVTFLYRYATLMDMNVTDRAALTGFSDADKVSAYAVETMAWAVAAKLVQGTDNNALAPQATATRAQVAMILCRFLNY